MRSLFRKYKNVLEKPQQYLEQAKVLKKKL